eukprot:TRINITY_DN835_c0_g1_i1.p1 TRINITY_DN835_c0_g1~~TRINITY_DN835_c0_g1_i1.p1  ORF type:complete len:441 (-),score=131.43 TRINITY_DN835_c0_g1_i1:111-1433(-)
MGKSRKHSFRPSYSIPSPSTPLTRYDTPSSVDSTPPQAIHSPHNYALNPSEFREVLQSDDGFPITMDQVMKWLDYTQRSSLIALMKRNFTPGVHYIKTPKSSKEPKTYLFSVESFKEMCKLRRNGERKRVAEVWSMAETLYGSHVPHHHTTDKKSSLNKRKIDIDDDDDDDDPDFVTKRSKGRHSKDASDSEPHSSISSPTEETLMRRRSMTGLVALDKKEMLYHSNDEEEEDSEYTTSGSESEDEPFTVKEKQTHRVITHTRIIHNQTPTKPSNSLNNSNSNVNNNSNNNNNNTHTSTPNKPVSPTSNPSTVASATSNNQASKISGNTTPSNTQHTNTPIFQWTENNARLEHILKIMDSSVPLMPISSQYSSFIMPNSYTPHTPSTFLTSLSNITSLAERLSSSSSHSPKTPHTTAQDFARENAVNFFHYRPSTQLLVE